VFAAVTFAIFGVGIQDPCTSDLDFASQTNHNVFRTIQALFCLALIFTIPMVLAAGRELVEEELVELLPDGHKNRCAEMYRNVIRTVLVAVLYFIVTNITHFGNIVNLVGSICCLPTGFVLPPLIHLKLKGSSLSLGTKILNWLVALGGVCVTIVSTYFAILHL